MSIETNRIWLSIESIELDRTQSNWLIEPIEPNRSDWSNNRNQSKSEKHVNVRLASIGSINQIELNRIQSNWWIESIEFDRSQSKPIKRKKDVNIRLVSIVRSITSIGFDRFDQSLRLALIVYDWFDNRNFRLTSPGVTNYYWGGIFKTKLFMKSMDYPNIFQVSPSDSIIDVEFQKQLFLIKLMSTM